MYRIKLPNFEGPFDLLLYFIKRDELNIYDIPIARITEEFLEYIRVMRYFDLELAGEFILMAANLMYIKSQMLLPKPKIEGSGEDEDPRTNLVQSLLAYKQIKDAAEDLSKLSDEQRYVYYRSIFDADDELAKKNSTFKNANLFDLMKAFKIAIERSTKVPVQHVVNKIVVTIDEKVELITKRLTTKPRLSFLDLVKNVERVHVVVTFLALLEMIKGRKVFITQEDNFEDIIISPITATN